MAYEALFQVVGGAGNSVEVIGRFNLVENTIKLLFERFAELYS